MKKGVKGFASYFKNSFKRMKDIFCSYYRGKFKTMNSVFNWNEDLVDIFETKFTFNCQSFSIVFVLVGAVDIIFPA